MKIYQDILKHLIANGVLTPNRTGTNTLSVFGHQIRVNLQEGFPLLTTKKVHFHSVVHELLWFIDGDTNVKYLQDNNVRIWDEWAGPDGELGPVYGAQWRRWKGQEGQTYDQITNLVHSLKTDPHSRRHIISAWNVAELPNMALSPCHCLVQFHVNNGKLSCQLYQRSADVFLGVPFNIASYALLTHMLAQQCDLEVGDFVHTFGDLHLYVNHLEQAKKQIDRSPKELPKLILNKRDSLFDYEASDIILEGYDPHPAIKAKVSV